MQKSTTCFNTLQSDCQRSKHVLSSAIVDGVGGGAERYKPAPDCRWRHQLPGAHRRHGKPRHHVQLLHRLHILP